MSCILLNLLSILALLSAAWAATVPTTQPHPCSGVQAQRQLLSSSSTQSLPACTNLLDASELHGAWVEGASDMEASMLLYPLTY